MKKVREYFTIGGLVLGILALGVAGSIAIPNVVFLYQAEKQNATPNNNDEESSVILAGESQRTMTQQSKSRTQIQQQKLDRLKELKERLKQLQQKK